MDERKREIERERERERDTRSPVLIDDRKRAATNLSTSIA
jgi:hypothetical protein